MPIINMAFKLENIPADAANVTEVNAEPGNGGHYWLYDTHVGLCIRDHEYNGRDDSDFYMTVWNAETNSPDEICFASTRGWSYPCYGSSADATPEVMAQYNAWRERIAQAARERRAREEAARPDKGKLLRVARGRKVAQGTEGVCFWIGQSAYGVRVGLETPAGRVFTALSNVEVVLASA